MYFIAGITGNVGGAAARRLLKQGHSVRALVRDTKKAASWSQQGVDVRQGDFNDPSALAAALEGVEGAYLMMAPTMTPAPGYPEARANIASFTKALQQAPPPRLVALSSVGSEQDGGVGNITATHLMEKAFADLPFPTAFVRAGGFLENYLSSLPGTKATGILYSLYQPLERPVPMIATVDIGNQVAGLLTSEWSGRRIIELGSPVSPNDLALALTDALGRPVQAQAVPRDRWTTTLENFGLPAGTTGPFEEMMDGFNSGWIAFGRPGTEPVAGTLSALEFFRQAAIG